MWDHTWSRRSESQEVNSKLHTVSYGSLIPAISVPENGSVVDEREYPVSPLLVPRVDFSIFSFINF